MSLNKETKPNLYIDVFLLYHVIISTDTYCYRLGSANLQEGKGELKTIKASRELIPAERRYTKYKNNVQKTFGLVSDLIGASLG